MYVSIFRYLIAYFVVCFGGIIAKLISWCELLNA